MDDAKWLAVLIGVIGALLGVYFRESLRRALNQKRIAAQLNAYLSYWEMTLLKTDLGALIILVQEWDRERTEAYRTRGKAGFSEAWTKQQAQLKEIKKQIKSGGSDLLNSLSANHQLLRKMPDPVFEAFMNEIAISRDALLQSRTFITDSDAAELAWWAAQRVVSIRGNLTSLLMHIRVFTQTLRNSENVDFMSISDTVVQIIEKLVDVTYEMQSLKTSTQRFADRSLMRLAIDNMRLSA
jgi:hypothetical protein